MCVYVRIRASLGGYAVFTYVCACERVCTYVYVSVWLCTHCVRVCTRVDVCARRVPASLGVYALCTYVYAFGRVCTWVYVYV